MNEPSPLASCGRCQVDGDTLHLVKTCPVHRGMVAFLVDSPSHTSPDGAALFGTNLDRMVTTFEELQASFGRGFQTLMDRVNAFQLPQCTGPEDAPMVAHWPGSALACSVCFPTIESHSV